MGLWRDDGDGEFEPGTPGDAFVTSCVTGAGGAAAGQCVFANLAAGGYWVQEISGSDPAFNVITTWAPGSFIIDNPPLPYAAYRYGDPAADRSPEFQWLPARRRRQRQQWRQQQQVTDWFANSRVNPPLPDLQCSDLLRVVLVLDRSGSINDNGPANYEAAALAFVNDLVGTNTEIGIVSFAAGASAASPLGSAYQSVQASNGTLDTVIAVHLRQPGRRHELGWRPATCGNIVRPEPAPRRLHHGRQPDRQQSGGRRHEHRRGQLGRLHGGRDVGQPAEGR